MISFENVSFHFETSRPILRDINLRIKEGERVCLLGLNGSGKSTLLKLCVGLLAPSSGQVSVGENSPDRTAAGFIFQNPDDQIVGASVEEDIAFALQNLQMPRDEIRRRVQTEASELNLIGKISAAPDELSAGEKQRLALAGTLVAAPSILLIDEPTSYLDDDGKAQLKQMISSSSATVLAATQFPEEVDGFDRVLFMREGEIAFDGLPAAFKSSSLAPLPIQLPARTSRKDDSVQLEAHNLGFSYDNQPVLNDFAHSFATASITAIIGASGSGKTTLALLLAGILQPEHGKIFKSDDSKIGLLLQFPEHNFFAETVFDEVAFAVRNQGLQEDRVQKRVYESLNQVGLDYEIFRQRDPFTLSAGEQRRAAIAAVLVMDCDIYVFDEITCGLDWEGRQLVGDMLVDLADSGKCVILCGHDMELVEAIGAEVVRLPQKNLRVIRDPEV